MLSTFAEGTIFGERIGAMPPKVVALHGWRKDHTNLAKVTEGFDAYSLDLPGFGATPPPPVNWGAEQYAQAIAKVFEEIGEPVVIVGHSFGGRVGVCLAAERPELVKAMVLTGAPLIRHGSTAKAPLKFRLAKFANKMGLLSDDRMEQERRKRGSDDYRAATGVMRDVLVRTVNESYEAQLKKVTCPVDLVWGELDTAATLKQAKEAQQLLANATLTVVPGGSHYLPTENPEPIREAIRKHLS